MQEIPPELSFSRQHLWAGVNERTMRATIGVSEYLVEGLGEILSIDMPLVGDELEMETFCIHMHLGDGGIYHLGSPLSGRVLEINRDVLDNPNLMHVAPYMHWLYKMEYDEPDEFHMLMSGSQYAAHLDHL